MSDLKYSAVVIKGESIIITIDGEPYTTGVDHVNYPSLLAAVERGADLEEIQKWLTPLSAIQVHAAESGFEIRANGDNIGVFWEGKEIHSTLVDMILQHFTAGHKFDSLKNFLIKCLKNKTPEKADVLFKFISDEALPLHEDGDFLAFKTVRSDGYDKHSRTVLYQIGEFIEPKNGIDWNEFHQCSQGLHIGGRKYVKNFGNAGDRYFVVKVSPTDCIFYRDPHGDGKMRVAKLFVYAETAGGDALLTALPTLQATIPTGDIAEVRAIVKKEAQQGETPKQAMKNLKKQAKAEKKERKAKETTETVTKAVETAVEKKLKEMSFQTTDGKTVTAKQLMDAVKNAGGQRGAARLLGVARTSIQGWLKQIGVISDGK